MKAGYTLLEIMVACAIVAVLFAIALPATTKISEYNARARSISNLRQIGTAARLYANDHDQQLPGQPGAASLTGGGTAGDQWPTLLCAYLSPSNPAVLLDPSDKTAARLSSDEILSNTANNTGYVYNGFDELGLDGRPPSVVRLTALSSQTETVLLAQKKSGAKPFCLDPLFQPIASLLDVLNPGAFDGGSHYLFVDGSVRFIKWTDYTNNFWLVDKGTQLPLPPLPPLPRGKPHGLEPHGLPSGSRWSLATLR